MPESSPDPKTYCRPPGNSAVGDALIGEIADRLAAHPEFLNAVLANSLPSIAPKTGSKPTNSTVGQGQGHTTVPVDAQIVAVIVALGTDDWVPLVFLRGFGSEPTLRKISEAIETRVIDKKKCVRIREFLAARSRLAEESANAPRRETEKP